MQVTTETHDVKADGYLRERSYSDSTLVPQVDRAAQWLAEHAQYESLTAAEEKKLMRRVDWIMIPCLFLTATFGAVDKVALSTASIYGLNASTGLFGQQYAWLGSILSLGALIGMFPSTLLSQKLPSAKYLSFCSAGWSTMALLMAACTNWPSLMVVRFFMGCFEAIIVPGISLLVAGWYKKDEQPPRNALIFAAASSVINGFLSWAIGNIENESLAKWQYLFLIIGSITFAWSIFIWFFLPNSPMDAIFLSDREKCHILRRQAGNHTGVENKDIKWDQVVEACIDPKTWLLFFFNIAINIPNGGLTTFNAVLIKNLGFSPRNASLLSMPTGIMSTLSAFVLSYAGAKWRQRRCLVTIAGCIVPIVGAVVVYVVPRSSIAGQIVGLYLLYTYFGPYVVGIGLAQANTAGYTKKNVSFGILYIGYAAGNLIGPQTFRASQAPAYTGGVVTMIICYAVCIALISLYWALCVTQNRRGGRGSADLLEDQRSVIKSYQDQTDFQQQSFRYTT